MLEQKLIDKLWLLHIHHAISTHDHLEPSGYQDSVYYTAVPGQARAKVDIRFSPGITPPEVAELVHTLEVTRWCACGNCAAPAPPVRCQKATTRSRKPLEPWRSSLKSAWRSGPSLTTAGTGHGDRAHAPDEYFTVGSVEKLMHWTVDYLHVWAEIVRSRRS